MKRDGPKEPTAIHGLSGLIFLPLDKTNVIADCLEKQFTPLDLCEENHERWVETRVQALFESVDGIPPETVRPWDVLNLINSLKLRKASGIGGIRRNVLGTFQEGHRFI
jgi:hypothetical protein